MASLSARALSGLPEVRTGDDLAQLVVQALHAEQPLATPLHDGQIVVIAHKVISKAEGAVVDLADVTPARARWQLAQSRARMHARCRSCSTSRRRSSAPRTAC